MRTRPKVILFSLTASTLAILVVVMSLYFFDYTSGRSFIPIMVASLLGFVVALLVVPLSGKAAVDKEIEALLDVRQTIKEFNQLQRTSFIEPSDYELVHPSRFIYSELSGLQKTINNLRDDFKKHQRLFNNMTEGLIIADGEGKIVTINPAAIRVFGVGEIVENTNLLHIIHDPRTLRAIRDVLEKRKKNTEDITISGKLGETYHITLSLIGGESIQQQGIIIYIRDVTALVRAERVRSDFVANVSHELKTPLTSIIGFSELMQSGVVKEPLAQQKYLSLIQLESERLLGLINDILKLSELESIAISHSKISLVDLAEIARRSIEVLSPISIKMGVLLELHAESACIEASADHISELFINLIDNAIKYNQIKGTVSVEVFTDENEAIVKVIDKGIGIPQVDQDRIFERFYRVDRSRSKERGGTGLGLSIVKHIVELYKGSITLDSALDKGTTIEVSFPLK